MKISENYIKQCIYIMKTLARIIINKIIDNYKIEYFILIFVIIIDMITSIETCLINHVINNVIWSINTFIYDIPNIILLNLIKNI